MILSNRIRKYGTIIGASAMGFLLFAVASAGLYAFGAAESDRGVLSVAMSGNPDTLDPHTTPGTLTFQTTRSMYDTLAEPDEEGEIVPALAERWEASEDATEWIFYLRENIRFHDGSELTAEDVVASIERMLDPDFGSPHADEFGPLERIEAVDTYSVRFVLSEPFAPLLATLATGLSAIMPAHLIAEDHDFGLEPVGTGPFRFVEWVQDSRIVLERNDDYWIEGQPVVDGVTFNIIVEPSVQLQGLLGGEFHVIDILAAEDLDTVRSSSETTVDESLSSLAMVMAMNTRREPFDNVDVRRAINHAVDKQQVLDIAYGGGEIGGTFMDTGDFYHRDFSDRYAFDRSRARELLANANVATDRELVISVPQNYDPHVTAGQLYQQMLEEVGLNVSLRLVEWSTWLSDIYSGGDYDLTVIGHTGKLDPDGRLGDLTRESFYTGWQNNDFNEAVRSARRTAEISERESYYERALEILADEVPMVFTGTSFRYIGLRASIEGFHMDGKLDTYDFRRTRIVE